MKHLRTGGTPLTSLALCAALTTVSATAAAQWQVTTSDVGSPRCSDFRFATGNTGWIAIDTNGVARTSNAGVDWQAITVPEGFATTAAWLYGDTWVLTAETNVNTGPVTTATVIQRSTDRGATWDPIEIDLGMSYNSVHLNAVQMASADIGYASGYTRADGDIGDLRVFLIRTADGGDTWTPLELPQMNTGNQVKLEVRGEDELFVLPLTYGPQYSNNGGGAWTQPTDAQIRFMAFEPGGTNALGFLSAAWFLDTAGSVFSSDNAGATLTDTGVDTGDTVDGQVGAGFTADGDVLLAMGLANDPYYKVLRSPDLGVTWMDETLPAEWTKELGCVAAADGMVYMVPQCLDACPLDVLRFGDAAALALDPGETDPVDPEADAGGVGDGDATGDAANTNGGGAGDGDPDGGASAGNGDGDVDSPAGDGDVSGGADGGAVTAAPAGESDDGGCAMTPNTARSRGIPAALLLAGLTLISRRRRTRS